MWYDMVDGVLSISFHIHLCETGAYSSQCDTQTILIYIFRVDLSQLVKLLSDIMSSSVVRHSYALVPLHASTAIILLIPMNDDLVFSMERMMRTYNERCVAVH